MADSKAKQVASRIAYVEPNDIYGEVNGVPLAPNYEDYCIGVNLIADVVPRYTNNLVEGYTNTMKIAWAGKVGENVKVSFMSGRKYGNNNFLTTYYTDISYEDIKEESEVEGLGIDNITIAFDSMYVPTVTIKFIDVRGSALFGREAAIHEKGKITAENVFGAFFTLPYPRFKLQVKGFYGRDVTYQLTCTDFRGNFNPTNGNFEATVKFIGYSYSLLTDIPFGYLVAAPFCEYEGRKYWENHVNSPEWRLDGKPMITIHQLINLIEGALIEKNEKNAINKEDSDRINQITQEVSALNEITRAYNDFENELRKLADRQYYYITSDKKDNQPEDVQLLICYNTVTENNGKIYKTMSDDAVKAHERLIELLTSYNSHYTEHAIPQNKFPSDSTQYRNTAYTKSYHMVAVDMFDIQVDTNNNNEVTAISVKGTTGKDVNSLKTVKLNNNLTMNQSMAETISKVITTKPYMLNARYATLFDIHDFKETIGNMVAKLNDEQKVILKRVNEEKAKFVSEILPIKPTIGNIYKILFAHLETFMHIMFQGKTDIINSDRRPSTLGVNINSTDAVNIDTLPPWPAVYTKDENANGQTDDYILGWIGDYSHNFVEEKIVTSILEAVQRVRENKNANQTNVKYSSIFPATPFDMNSMNNPFVNTTQLDLSSLGGYLGIRAAQIFGIMFNEINSAGVILNTDLISLIGRMDALNYFKAAGSISAVKSNLFNRIGSQSLSEILKNITICNTNCDMYGNYFQNTGKSRHKFENNLGIRPKYNNNQRCPIFITDDISSDRYKFVRYYSQYSANMDVALVPSILDEFSNYSDTFVYNGNNGNPYFEPTYDDGEKNLTPNDFIHRSTTRQLLNGDTVDVHKRYINEDLFNIVDNSDDVNSILARYEELKQGNVEIMEYESTEDFKPLLNKCWLVENSNYANYFNGYGNMFTVSLESYGYDKKNLLSNDQYSTTHTVSNLTDESWINLDETNNVLFTDNGEYSKTKQSTSQDGTTTDTKETLSINDLKIHQLKLYYNKDVMPMSLFGHMFYYMQNSKLGSETDAEFNDRSSKVKALLFLHTLRYNFDYKPNFVKTDKKNGVTELVPYGYLLFLGGMLWRNRYYQEYNSVDPVIYREKSISFKAPSITQTFFVKENGKYNFSVMDSGSINRNYNVSIQSILGYSDTETNWEFDYVVENELISYFEKFANNTFKDIALKSELRYIQSENSTVQFTANTFTQFVKTFSDLIYKQNNGISDLLTRLNKTINNLYKNYSYIAFRKSVSGGVTLMINEDSEVQETVKNLYYGKNVILDSLGFRLNKNSNFDTNVYVRQNTFNTYVDAFAKQLEKIVSNEKVNKPLYDMASDNSNFDKQVATDMYYYLKNLYDRWLIQTEGDDYYTVRNFYDKNFVFMDKFYVNIRDIFVINCEKLINTFKERLTDDDSSIFSVIGDIVKDHNCMFVALPDYLGITGKSLDDDIKAMEEAFKPLPYNEMGEPRDENHFVTIYVGPTASIASEMNNYKDDGFDINTPDEIPAPFKSKGAVSEDDTDAQSRYGYNVPAFGVSFARQNQQIFKNISLSMANPMATGISINVTSQVAELGSSHEHKVMFYGQDIYNIYKNYSYDATIEMMGDAQIQPLMYFQLLNIPMWHGAYMIMNVSHTITPGNMTTTFRGQKMSRYMPRYTKEYFYGFNILDTIESENNTTTESTNVSDNINDITLPESYSKVSAASVDISDIEKYRCPTGDTVNFRMGGKELYKGIKVLFKQLVEEIKLLPENRNREVWNICLSSAVRDSGNSSEHNYARGGISPNAIDMQIVTIGKNGKRTRVKDAEKLFTVMDILVTNHFNEIGQLIFEGKRSDNGTDGVTKWFNGGYKSKSNDAYTCLHLSYRGNTVSTGEPCIFLSGNNDGRNFATSRNNVQMYSEKVPPEYKAIAKKVYANTSDMNGFRRTFPYYRCFTDSELVEHFGEVRMSNTSDTGYVNASSDNATKRRNNPGNLEWLKNRNGTIKEGDGQWLGYDISGKEWSPRFCVFKNMTYGMRALFVNMNTQITRGHNTIAQLIGVWAPSHENNTDDYVKAVAKAANVSQYSYVLKSIVKDKAVCIAIAKQIAIQEGGIRMAESEINKAYEMAANYIQTK